jgi:hypothetical protein
MSLIRTFVGYCVPHDETQWSFKMLIIVSISQELSPSTSSLRMCQKTHIKGATCFFITWVRIDDLYVNLDVGNSTTTTILCITWLVVFNYFVQKTHLMFVAKYNYCFLWATTITYLIKNLTFHLYIVWGVVIFILFYFHLVSYTHGNTNGIGGNFWALCLDLFIINI